MLDNIQTYYLAALQLLKKMIAIPSLSKQEDGTADLLATFFLDHNIDCYRKGNNIYAKNQFFDESKPSILLNSHHDTVKPISSYTLNPYQPLEKDLKLYGLGSNDAGGSLVSLIYTFIHFYSKKMPYNLILAATAEEENSGDGGIISILNEIPVPEFAIVGEPTEMEIADAEKGLMVIDVYAKGKAGHAARNTGINAIYLSMNDITWFKNYTFKKTSQYLGQVKMTVTEIKSGYQHNVIPDTCHFVVDIRTTEQYSNEEILDIIKKNTACEIIPRSTKLKPSVLPSTLSVATVAHQLGIKKNASLTTSDQAVMPFPSLKMGPGQSERSHTADEFIYLKEIKHGIQGYIHLLQNLFDYKQNL